jgi:hypothetical protein
LDKENRRQIVDAEVEGMKLVTQKYLNPIQILKVLIIKRSRKEASRPDCHKSASNERVQEAVE